MLQTIAETSIFTRQANALFTSDEKVDLINFLASNPLAGDEIPGTGGVRKVRIAARGKGKSGGRESSIIFTMKPLRCTRC